LIVIVKRLLQFVRVSGIWAPATVLIIHEYLAIPGWRTQVDWFNHFCGGLSFTFFAYKSLPYLAPWTGKPTRIGRLGVAFLAGCTAALLWEILEFSSDLIFGSHIQKSIHETMMDIVNGFLGTTTTVLALLVLTKEQRTQILDSYDEKRITEALARRDEMSSNPAAIRTLEELKRDVGR
jgi:hypothetical protein